MDNEYAVVIPKFITCILNDESPPVHSDGLQERDFTFVDNVVKANVKAANSTGAAGEVINIACGRANTVLSIVDKVNKILGKNVKPLFGPERAGDVRKTLADVTKLKEKLGIDEFIGFDEGLERTVDWFKMK